MSKRVVGPGSLGQGPSNHLSQSPGLAPTPSITGLCAGQEHAGPSFLILLRAPFPEGPYHPGPLYSHTQPPWSHRCERPLC